MGKMSHIKAIKEMFDQGIFKDISEPPKLHMTRYYLLFFNNVLTSNIQQGISIMFLNEEDEE